MTQFHLKCLYELLAGQQAELIDLHHQNAQHEQANIKNSAIIKELREQIAERLEPEGS